jgi:hypothetical protein
MHARGGYAWKADAAGGRTLTGGLKFLSASYPSLIQIAISVFDGERLINGW